MSVIVLWIVAAARPAAGACAMVVGLPLALALGEWVGGLPWYDEIADAFLLAFVSGASLTLARQRQPGERLAGPALVLIAVVLASSITEFRELQAIRPRYPLVADIWHHVKIDYFGVPPGQFPFVHHGVRWVAWLTAAIYVERAFRRDREATANVFRWWVTAGAVAAAFFAVRLLEIVMGTGGPVLDATLNLAPTVRLAVLQPDVNAAGSYFLLFFVPVVVVLWRSRLRLWGLIAMPMLLLALGLTRSRAAIAAAVVVLGAAAMRAIVPVFRSWTVAQRAAMVAGVVLTIGVGLAAVTAVTAQSNVRWRVALGVRLEMLDVGLRAAARRPLFGAGLASYRSVTGRLTSPEWPRLYKFAPTGENAHNNFLQILVELGAPALLLFVWLLAAGIRDGLPFARAPGDPMLDAMALGVVAFLLSALLGHPLLISMVGTTFFVAVGLTAALSRPQTRPEWVQFILWTFGVFYVVSAALR